MAGSEAQAGCYYQNVLGAQYVLDLVEFGTPLRSLTFENPRRAKHVDDIIAASDDVTAFVQVKWSQDDTSAFTLHNLVTAEDDSISLLAKLAKGFQQVATEDGQKEIILFSNRKAGTYHQPKNGFDRSLTEFIDEFHQPFVDANEVTHIEQATAFDAYRTVLERLIKASGLQNLNEFSRFLKSLRFRLNQPDRDTLAKRIRVHLERLGIGQGQYAALLDEVVKWSISGQEVQRDDALRALGLLDRFVDRISHDFPVDRKLWVPTPCLFETLDASIGSLEEGFVLLEGEPGSGKSTALTMYLSQRKDVLFGYYCFVPDDRSIGNERLGEDAFVRSICIGLQNAFPDIRFPQPYAPCTIELLNEWLKTLSAAGRRVVFVVDGVDHVDRKSRQSLIARPLTTVLDAELLPRNVLIVLSSRYPEALPQAVLHHIGNDSRRHVQMPRFDGGQVRGFLRLRGVGLTDEILDAVVDISGGVPIYLEYLADHLRDMTRYEQEQYLQSVPTLRDRRIDHYHEHLWDGCSGDDRLVYILAILATRDEFTTPETLCELLRLVRVDATLNSVHDALAHLHHVLRRSDARSVAIRHSSLADFVSERTEQLRDEVNQAMVEWYAEHPDADEAWRHRLRHLFQAGEYAKVLAICDDAWLMRAWACHRPIPEIQRNLDIAWRAASVKRDILEFIRVGLLKQRIALVGQHLNLSEGQVARLLLDMGCPEEALRRVWDGERRQCGSVEFAKFCLAHLESTRRVPAQRILSAALGDHPDHGSSPEETTTWFRALSHVRDPIDLLQDIEHIRWRTEAARRHIRQGVTQDENRNLNLDLQLAILRELAERRDLEGLDSVRNSDLLHPTTRTMAGAAIGLGLARAGETSEAMEALRGLDISCIPDVHRRWLVLETTACGLDALLAHETAAPPRLPTNLLDSDEQHFGRRLFDLYDELRIFFLRDETSFPWFEATVTGLAEPVRTVVFAIGRLARQWTFWVRKQAPRTSAIEVLKAIIHDLDLNGRLFAALDHRRDYADALRQNAPRFYEQAWSCATLVLSATEFEELARWWIDAEAGARAMRYPDATRTVAIAVSARLKDKGCATARALLDLVERSARTDEETSVIASGLLECASAWGRSGFREEAQRLWCELLHVACGVHWRKDYQFNEILNALKLAHEQDPHATLQRVEEQLALAHQLEDTAQSKTVAVAIEEFLEFVARLDPALALDGLVHEERLIPRDRALRKVVLALLEDGSVDRRLLLSLAATMDRWSNYRGFDEETKPAMFAVYRSALRHQDIETARRAYNMWRQVLLVEKEMPDELGRWAAEWVQSGEAPPDVLRDHIDYPPPEEAVAEPTGLALSGEDEQLTEELDRLANGDLGILEERLDEVLREGSRRDRRSELDRIRADWYTVLGQAAGREWSEDEERILDRCFETFSEAAMGAPSEAGYAAREAVREALSHFLDEVSSSVSCKITLARFERFFDLDEWLDGLIGSPSVAYSLERKIEARLSAWIASAPLAKLKAWEDFCVRRCNGATRAAGLLALAERRAAIEPDRAAVNLFEAWESASVLFHEHGTLARRIISKLLELDPDRGFELLFESFRHQYQRMPEAIIYRLDKLLDFADKLPGFDAERLYAIWSTHNRILATGLSEKETDLSWLKHSVHRDFQDACLEYLIGLFDYPEVDVRLLALEELFRLLREREELIATVLSGWSSYGEGRKEHIVLLLFSLGMDRPASVERWAVQLLALIQKEGHHNMQTTAAEAILTAADRRAALDPRIVAEAQALKKPPGIVLAQPPLLRTGFVASVRFPAYLQWSVDVLSRIAADGELEGRTREILSRLYSRSERGIEEEAAVHRAYNINTNYDIIEISGEYDQAVRAALNRAVQALVRSHAVDHDALTRTEDLLRLGDPTDNIVRRVPRPARISWINDALPDGEFIGFADIDALQVGDVLRDGDWITVYEYTEQRTGDRFGSDAARVHKGRVTVFGAARFGPPLTLHEVTDKVKEGALSRIRNRYRFELARDNAPSSISRVRPIVVVTDRCFRGRSTPNLAAIVSELAKAMAWSPHPDDLLGYVSDGEQVVRSIEWQESFDQGRRRHEPRSCGFLLQVKREALARIAEAYGIELRAHLTAERTTGRYKPEHEMEWHKHEDVFTVELA